MSWIDGPWAAFDSETTGVDVEQDRIVTACVGFAPAPGIWEPWTVLINPGVDIPAGATAVHGVTTGQARRDGIDPVEALQQIVSRLNAAWSSGAPVVGHNVVFDLTLLDRECRRHLGQPFPVTGPVIDTLVCDKIVDRYRRGSRKLTTTAAHYGVSLSEDDAHSADADAKASLDLAQLIVETVGTSGSPAEGRRLADLSLPVLHRYQADQYEAQRRSFFDYLRRKGETPDSESTEWPIGGWAA